MGERQRKNERRRTSKLQGNVLEFPPGGRFKRAGSRQTDRGQLSLFPAQILALPVLNPYEQAVRFDEAGEAGKARALYLEAIGSNTNAADAHCNLGILESKDGRTVDALECFARALAVDPEHAESHYNMALVYLQEEDYRLARLHFELSYRLDPAPQALYCLGVAHAFGGETGSAMEVLARYKDLVTEEEREKADALLEQLERQLD
ncbi:MAG: tetratricopeptide repeat protein [Candidatus Latescibacteria bacterium]|mgnify:CR=1 FL=1|nr:tetratricopeptide repeat protein [Candidatus Latescibacterota bacterium]